MLKKIACDQARAGMYVARLDGPWLQHPFWRGAFALKNLDDVRALRDSGIPEVWIDTARGADVEAPPDERVVVVDDIRLDDDDAATLEAAPVPGAPGPAPLCSTAEEVSRARRIFARSRPLLQSIFANARLGRAIDRQQTQELLEEMSQSLQRNPWALLSIVRLKRADDYTYMHSAAVGALMLALSRELQLPRAQQLSAGLAGMMHDIGKASIPQDILNKPVALTEDEFALIKTHPRRGQELLLAMGDVDATVLDVCLHHHERIDGAGYPDGLAGSQISQLCRMASICDIYDATTSDRPYKTGWNPAESLRRMARWAPAHIDEQLFHHFVKCVGIYPIGSFVLLESQRLGVVVDQTPQALLQPTVKVLFSKQSRGFIAPQLVALAEAGCQDRIVGLENPSRWGIHDPAAHLHAAPG